MYKEHHVFEKPKDKNAKIWRYVDFTKFVSLLDKSALFFARADKLGDPFEGSFPEVNVKLRPELYGGKIPPKILEDLSQLRRRLLRNTVVSCWHLSEYESAAMWKLYIKSDEGITIRSTFKQLTSCFKDEEHDIHVGIVKYIDYEKDWMPEGNTLYPFLHKRKSFKHEQEVRAIIQGFHYWKNGGIDFRKTPFNSGAYITVDLDTLIDEIRLAPTCPEWLHEVVRSVTERYGLDKKVLRSDLDKVPFY